MNHQTRLISKSAGLLICLFLFQEFSLAARKVELTLSWNELGPAIQRRTIAVVLTSGVHLAGKVMEVTPDGLLLNVAKSSDTRAHPKGRATVARSAVSVIQLSEFKGSRRALWTGIGLGTGLVAGWLLAEGVYHVSGEGQGLWAEPVGAGLILGWASAGGAAGYFGGRSSDKVETYIKIAPEPTP